MLPAILTVGAVAVLIGACVFWRRRPNDSEQTFHFRCNHCRQKLRYRAESQGRRIMCPHCLLPCTVPHAVNRSSTA
jgi:hypothetical protein